MRGLIPYVIAELRDAFGNGTLDQRSHFPLTTEQLAPQLADFTSGSARLGHGSIHPAQVAAQLIEHLRKPGWRLLVAALGGVSVSCPFRTTCTR